MDDSSDILGGQLHVASHDSLLPFSGLSFTGLLSATILVLAALYGLQLLYPHYRLYQERRYRKSMRRRHGIPDNDHRPFNVAYAAAKRAQKEREAKEKGISIRSSSSSSVVGGQVAEQPVAATTGQATRQRQRTAPSAQPLQSGDTEEIPQSRSGYLESRRTSGQTVTASESEYYVPGIPQEAGNEKLVRSASSSSLYAPAFARTAALGTGQGKRALEDEDIDTQNQRQGSKKTRLVNEPTMDSFNEKATDADVDDDMEIDEASPVQPKRGAKRLASLDDDEGFESSQAIGRDKRPRKALTEDSLLRTMRGKKRDRAEAGSTFGGDDEAEGEVNGGHRSQRRRRVGNKKSTGNIRGRKRARDSETADNEDESDSPSTRAARHKRGKRSAREENWTSDDDMVSHDPLCKGRHIGEVWEVNGHTYKVGPNGQRLRRELVNVSQEPRFNMPQDSEHPDGQRKVDVFEKRWLSEEEYQLAKERNLLAWQDTSNTATGLAATTDVPETPTKGKSLLYRSTATKEARKQQALGQSVAPNGAASANSSQPSHGTVVRRISTMFAPVVHTPPESPKLRPTRLYSRWEKQDLEANAMTKLRKTTKSDVPVPNVPEKKTVTFAEGHISIPPSGLPPQSSTKPADAVKPSASFSLANPATAEAVQPAKASTSDLPSLTIPSTTRPNEPTKSSDPSSSSQSTKIPAAAPPTTTPFSFSGPPTAQPAVSSTSTQPPAVNMPNFFAKPAVPAASSTPNTFGAPANQSGSSSTTQSTSTPNMFGSAPQPSATPAAPTTSGASTQSTANSFGFGAPAATNHLEEKPAQTAQTSSGASSSLLARLGGFTNDASQPTTANTSNAPTSQPVFFAKPGAPASATASAAPSTSTQASSGSNAPVKFNFGVTSKAAPASTANPSSTTAVTPATTDAAKPTATFSFGATGTPAAASNATSEAPKATFGFGAPAAGTSAFGSNGASSAFGGTTTIPKDVPVTPNPKSAFAMPKTPANTSAFGASTTPAGTPSGAIFGIAKPAPSTPVTPANASVFGDAMSTTPAGTPPTTSAFGNHSASTTPAGPPPAKSAFSFASNTASGSSGPIFGNTSKPAASSSTPVFGQPTSSAASSSQPIGAQASSSKPIFSFTAPPAANAATGSAASTFSFGSTNGAATSTSTPAVGAGAPAQNKSMFNFASGGSTATPAFGTTAFGSSNGAAAGSAAAGTGQSAKPTPTPSMFGFSAPTGASAFTFGKPPESGPK